MLFVTGGASSGKRAYLKTLGYADEDMADAVIDARPVVYNVQAMAARDPENCMELLEALLQKEVVVCDEVGGGVIPATPRERAIREQTGRLSILLAQSAQRVVRLVCGVPTVLKG
ncbi:MAG: bifunctional adenosylcobinamide kinase/adenosylcobinamide-phosphate guanylyltransferase [Eubacteriales bacterium]|nr:bifunctional adenosylcobinamide kinase/adenosylcobinamide-phosphate guanylyltransferase [Eubacteriales bacterium]